MKDSIICGFIFSAILSLPVHGQNLKVEQADRKHSTRGKTIAEYTINDTVVSQKKFDEFLKGLIEIEHTWYCAETNTGGRTGYDAKDKNGHVYEYMSETDSNKSRNSVRIKKELK